MSLYQEDNSVRQKFLQWTFHYILIRGDTGKSQKHFSILYTRAIISNFNHLLSRFSLFLDSLLEDRVLHKGAWVAALLGSHLSIQNYKKVKFSGPWQSKRVKDIEMQNNKNNKQNKNKNA